MRLSHISSLRVGLLSMSAAAALGVAGCEGPGADDVSARANAPISKETLALMQEKGTSPSAPVLIRTYKKEAEFEVWKMKSDGRYALLKTYPICRWSGQLGPKAREGDRQVPEGFYSVTPAQMKPNSAYYLAFNVGYPNAYDRALGHDGGSIMVHGVCSSRGCFSMTDDQMREIYAVVRESFAGGQRDLQLQSYPFHMTAENMAKYRADPNIAFWRQLKDGSDNFETTKKEVAVAACGGRYVFNATPVDGRFDAYSPCPQFRQNEEARSLVAAKQAEDDAKIAELTAQGVKPIRTIYADGGQHPKFAALAVTSSRPDTLAMAPTDVPVEEKRVRVALDDKKGKSRVSPVAQMATAALQTAAPARAADAEPMIGVAAPAGEVKPTPLTGWFGGLKPAEGAISVAAKQSAQQVAQ